MDGGLDPRVPKRLQALFRSMGDLERLICRIHAQNPVKNSQFVACVENFRELATYLSSLTDTVSEVTASPLLQRLLTLGSPEMPDFRQVLEECTSIWSVGKNGEIVIKEGFGDENLQSCERAWKEASATVNSLLEDAKSNVHPKTVYKITANLKVALPRSVSSACFTQSLYFSKSLYDPKETPEMVEWRSYEQHLVSPDSIMMKQWVSYHLAFESRCIHTVVLPSS
jgi:DNA mismatch repair ATPase MutS